jgi:hypothetical protein
MPQLSSARMIIGRDESLNGRPWTEVEKKAYLEVRRAKIVHELRGMRRLEPSARFQLDNDS